MKKLSIISLAAVLLATSCHRDPILEEMGTYHMNFICEDSTLYLHPLKPQLMQLHFYDIKTGDCVRSTYAYPSGLDFYINPGDYDIACYTVAKNSTKFTYVERNRYDLLTVETEVIGKNTSYGDIITAPSHIYYGQLDNYRIPYVSTQENGYNIDMHLATPLDSWIVIIDGIENLKYCQSIQMYITEQYKEIELKDMERKGRAVVAFSGYVDNSYTVVKAPFVTFGMIPDKPYTLQVQMTDTGGYNYQTTVDVTGQVLNPDNKEHIITFSLDWVLQKLIPGGLEPTAEEWDVEKEKKEIS